jgi:4'-phosphopantetheinyl transferase
VGVDVWYVAGQVPSQPLVRRVLSTYRPVAPEAWRFTTGSHGKPLLDPDCGLVFSVAHTDGLTVVAVCTGDEVGVDVERVDRRVPLGVAGRWFAPAELEALAAAPEPERARRFLELWTLKEAYVKARGLGVIGLSLASFVIDPAGPRLQAAADDDPARWHLTLRAHGDHLIAVATTNPEPVSFRELAA